MWRGYLSLIYFLKRKWEGVNGYRPQRCRRGSRSAGRKSDGDEDGGGEVFRGRIVVTRVGLAPLSSILSGRFNGMNAPGHSTFRDSISKTLRTCELNRTVGGTHVRRGLARRRLNRHVNIGETRVSQLRENCDVAVPAVEEIFGTLNMIATAVSLNVTNGITL